MNTKQTVIKSMYETRRKIFPIIPKALFKAKAMIFQNKKDFVSWIQKIMYHTT
jgi:hypothetical protein